MSQTDPEWTVRPYAAGDEDALVELFGRVFGRPTAADHWRWKLGPSPAWPPTAAPNVWLAVAGGRPIFQYAGIPLRFQTPAGPAVAMLSVDTMTDPAFRRRGLLTGVGAQAYAAWRAAGVGFVLGLPNDKWGSRTGALNWDPLFALRWLIRPLRPEALAARRLAGRFPAAAAPLSGLAAPAGAAWNAFWDRRLPRDPGLRVRMVGRAGAEFDRLWEGCRADAGLSVIRDRAWVNWRYLAAPGRDYRVLLAERRAPAEASGWAPAGYIAYRLDRSAGRRGMIAELTTRRGDQAARRTLLRHAIDHLRAGGAETLATLAVAGSADEDFFRRAGFIFGLPGCFSVQYVPLATALPPRLFRDLAAWSLAGGDFDVI